MQSKFENKLTDALFAAFLLIAAIVAFDLIKEATTCIAQIILLLISIATASKAIKLIKNILFN